MEDQNPIYKQAIDTFGVIPQVDMLIEEMAELTHRNAGQKRQPRKVKNTRRTLHGNTKFINKYKINKTHMKENAQLLAPLVTINVRHDFTEQEILHTSAILAKTVKDKEGLESEKKAVNAEFKNNIDKLSAEIKLYSGHINNGYMYSDRPAELWLDYETSERFYVDKHSGEELKREPFHPSDYQKKIDFDEQQKQIEENNQVGGIANGELGYDANGNLTDIQANIVTALDPLGKVIENKVKASKPKKEKPTARQ